HATPRHATPSHERLSTAFNDNLTMFSSAVTSLPPASPTSVHSCDEKAEIFPFLNLPPTARNAIYDASAESNYGILNELGQKYVFAEPQHGYNSFLQKSDDAHYLVPHCIRSADEARTKAIAVRSGPGLPVPVPVDARRGAAPRVGARAAQH